MQLGQKSFNDKYELGNVLGTGAFSEVRLGTCRSSGEKFAIKIIDRAKCKGKEDMIETEVKILQRMDHPNIVKLYGKVTGGELFDEIVGRGSIPEREAAQIIEKILHAVNYLHQRGIVHRDLKPENLLLAQKGSVAQVKISDFGLSKIFSDEIIMKTACGTPGYVAPEVLRREGYSKEVDLWSLGVITYILLCGYPPFFDQKNAELFKKIMAGRFQFDHPWWDHISDKAKDFVRNLLVVKTNKRFTAEEALLHPFIAQLNPPIINPRPIHTLSAEEEEENLGGTLGDLAMISVSAKSKSERKEITQSNETIYSSNRHTMPPSPGAVASIEKTSKEVREKVKSIFGQKVGRLASWIRIGSSSKRV